MEITKVLANEVEKMEMFLSDRKETLGYSIIGVSLFLKGGKNHLIFGDCSIPNDCIETVLDMEHFNGI